MNSISTDDPNLESRRPARPVRDRRADAIPGRTPWLFRGFRNYSRGYIRRHFHALRVARSGPLPDLPDGPLIVVVNHAAWWDPLIGLVLSAEMPERRSHFA